MLKSLKLFVSNLIDFKNHYCLLLVLLISTDLVFMVVHSLNMYGIIGRNGLYDIENDHGYSEVFQYIKEFWCFIILLTLSIREKLFTFFIWALLFLYLLLDDSLSFHEIGGRFLVNYFDITSKFKLRADDLGELLISACAGIFFMVFLFIGYIKSNNKLRNIFLQIFTLLLVLVFFGVFVDMLHVYFNHSHKIGLIEDGGEMLTMSVFVSYFFKLVLNFKH